MRGNALVKHNGIYQGQTVQHVVAIYRGKLCLWFLVGLDCLR